MPTSPLGCSLPQSATGLASCAGVLAPSYKLFRAKPGLAEGAAVNGHDRHSAGIVLKHARSALFAIDPGQPREDWHRVGRAAIAAGLSVADLDEWSSSAPNYKGKRDVEAAFRTVRPDGGTGPGTLWSEAMKAGWRPPRDESEGSPQRVAREPRKEAKMPLSAAEVWSRCVQATAEHPYIAAKQGLPDGLRVVPHGDPLRIAGLSMAGALVVPVVPLAGGEPVSLQFVAGGEQAVAWKAEDKPSKLNLPGATVSGCYIVGKIEPGGTAYIVEGVGQGWACWKATGKAAIVTFGFGRMRAVAERLRERDPAAKLVLVPDAGKEVEAGRIAADVGAEVARMPEGSRLNFDCNDYALAHGFDALESLLALAAEPSLRVKLLSSADLRAMPAPAWRVRNLLPVEGLASIYGPSTAGKSFLALDLFAAIASGAQWFGHRTRSAPVVYVVLEGAAGFRLRVQAFELVHGPLPGSLRIVMQPLRLTEPRDVADLADAVKRLAPAGAVVAIDTLNAAAPTVDENSSADMGRVIEAAKHLQRELGGLVVLIAHAGKDATKGLRGHSSLFAALDAAIEVTREGDRREWRPAKAKDAADDAKHAFKLRVVELDTDEDGDRVTSCVVAADTGGADVVKAKLPQGGNQKIALDALRPAFRESTAFGRGGAPAVRPCVEISTAIERVAGRLVDSEPSRRTSRAREAVSGLVGRGLLGSGEGWLWLI